MFDRIKNSLIRQTTASRWGIVSLFPSFIAILIALDVKAPSPWWYLGCGFILVLWFLLFILWHRNPADTFTEQLAKGIVKIMLEIPPGYSKDAWHAMTIPPSRVDIIGQRIALYLQEKMKEDGGKE